MLAGFKTTFFQEPPDAVKEHPDTKKTGISDL